MARPRKEGMEYFPHDTDARNDLKIRKLRAIFGNDGYATYFILLENIYRNKTYSIDISDAETMLILAEECKISETKLSEIVLKCLDLDLFSKHYYNENKVLTSESIKKRTEPIENKRKKNNEHYNNIKSEVLDAETNDKIEVSDAEIPAESTQSKVKESKEYIKNIFEYWNSEKIVVHKSIVDKIKTSINKAIKNKYTEEEIIQAINNYSNILKGDQYYFNYKWSLAEFLDRGLEKFLDWEVCSKNYSKMVGDKNGGVRKDYTSGASDESKRLEEYRKQHGIGQNITNIECDY